MNRNIHIHIRKRPDDATAKPVWSGATGVASITEAWADRIANLARKIREELIP